ncbi:acyl-CoA thioesterase [Tindallia californiensis]|uniref:Acyl-CoA thioester hydrolase n=1 Tax=Tindallia californiensis TaxID=159292 RepID=A0A1H3IN21_9FIRM|nr:thioesterase family protein [Tindallia californiensis]SDY29176.1 acyl-CoA thioester hydrolase [Tindallia californiensis]
MQPVHSAVKDYRFYHQIRVRYPEVDMQQIVFNANYLTYLDMAWVEYLRNIGLDYGELLKNHEFDSVVAKVTMEYKKPARYDEVLDIYVRVPKLGNKSIPIHFTVCKEGTEEIVLEGEIFHVSYDFEKELSCPIPAFVEEKIRLFEGF